MVILVLGVWEEEVLGVDDRGVREGVAEFGNEGIVRLGLLHLRSFLACVSLECQRYFIRSERGDNNGIFGKVCLFGGIDLFQEVLDVSLDMDVVVVCHILGELYLIILSRFVI
jgi:hypothetical protein